MADNRLCFSEEKTTQHVESYAEILSKKMNKLTTSIENAWLEGDYRQALFKLNKAIALNENNSDLYTKRGETYLRLGDYNSATVNFKHSLALDEDLERTHRIQKMLTLAFYLSGRALFDQSMYKLALEKFTEGAELDPSNIPLRMLCVACLHELGEDDRCMSLIEDAIGVDPTNPELYIIKARLSYSIGNFHKCYHDIKKALELDDSHEQAQQLLLELEESAKERRAEALQLSASGEKEQAVKKISTAIETDPSSPEYHVFRGTLFRHLGNYNEAQNDFHKAIHKCGHNEDHPMFRLAMKQLAFTYNDVAVAHYKKDRTGQAVELLNRAVAVEKAEPFLYVNRGACFQKMKNLQFALADFEQAMELLPQDWTTRTRVAMVNCDLGLAMMKSKKPTESLAYFTKAIELNPKVGRFYYCRSTTNYVTKNILQSQDDLMCALLLDPESEEVPALMARLFPGQTSSDLLKTKEAKRIRESLEMKESAIKTALKREDKNEATNSSKKVKKGIMDYHVELQVIDDSTSEQDIEDLLQLTQVGRTAPKPSMNIKRTPSNGSHCDGSAAVDDVLLSPRTRQLLAQPLPHISGANEGVVPNLKQCIEEEKFHSSIYYAQKEVDQRVHVHLLESSIVSPALPRLEVAKEVKFGSRRVEPVATDISYKK